MIIKGKSVKLGDNIDTDLIIPGRYLQITDVNELKKHIFEDLDKSLRQKIKPSTILIAGENFGCGSSREHAPRALKASGVSAIVAKSFARIFFRNSINIGLPVFTSLDNIQDIPEDAEIEIDTKTGIITDLKSNKKYSLEPYPEFLENLVEKGLVNFVRSFFGKNPKRDGGEFR